MRTWGRSSVPLLGTSGCTRHDNIQTLPSTDTKRCQEHLRAAPNHEVILRDNDIPQLHRSWDENITDLVSGIPLELLPIWEVNHKINPKNISATDCWNVQSISIKSSLRKLRDTPQHSGGYPQWHTRQCQCCVYWRKVVNYILFSIYKNRMITWSRMWLHSLTKISFVMIWPGPHISQSSICLKHMNKYTSYQSTSIRQHSQQSLAHLGAKWCRWVIVTHPLHLKDWWQQSFTIASADSSMSTWMTSLSFCILSKNTKL